MARSVSISVDGPQEGMRLDALLNQRGLYASRSRAVRALEQGRVFVNGAAGAKNHRVSAGELIVCELDEEQTPIQVLGEPIELDVRYEDEGMLVLSKPAGMLTHPSEDHRTGTLVNALVHRYGREGLCNVQGDDDRPGIVHRLDGDTSGLMLAAKTDEVGRILMDDIALKSVDRRYLALVHGNVSADSGMVDAPIARNPKNRLRMGVFDTPSAREAMTTFTCLARFAPGLHDHGFSLLECKLYTGRTHQIRVHMAYIAHPIVGDQTYTSHAPKDPRASLGLDRQFLHSHRLALAHPLSGEPLSFEDRLPGDLSAALRSLEDRCEYLSEGFAMEDVLDGSEGEA